jgi:hypothetical protein
MRPNVDRVPQSGRMPCPMLGQRHPNVRPVPVDLLAGAALLPLISNWDAWVSRRVDSFAFAGDDERVLERHQSIDYELPTVARRFGSQHAEVGGYPVPITIVNKWRLPHFSLQDEDGAAVSLMARSRSSCVSTGILTSLASLRCHGTLLDEEHLPPAAVRDYLHAIVDSDASDALQLCAELQNQPVDRPDDQPAREWFQDLASDEEFMSLAFEFARGFLLIGLLEQDPGPLRKIIKFSYHSYVVPARRDRGRTRLAHFGRWLRSGSRDVTDSIGWYRRDERRNDTGRIVVSSVCDLVSSRIREGIAGVACALLNIEGPDGRRRTVRLRVNAALALERAPAGRYYVEVHGRSGFEVSGPPMFFIDVKPGDTRRLEVRATATNVAEHLTLAPTFVAQPAFFGRELVRGLAWLSKPLAIRLRIGDGGAYHCELEAPAGLHVTRARLISNAELAPDAPERRRELDIVLASTQRAHLYAAADDSEPATAYAYFNLRPRVETIVRPAYWTAWAAAGALAFVAATWRTKGGFKHSGPPDPSALVALILGAPSALAAYFAQAVPSRVTNSMLYGLRLSALLPAILSVLAAAVMLVGQGRRDAHLGLWCIVAAGLAVIAILGAAERLAEHPREQRRRDLEQGHGFERKYSTTPAGPSPVTSNEAGNPPEDPPSASRTRSDTPEAIRDRLLERSDGLTRSTRRILLTQRGVIRKEFKVPPALYFDSAETPPTFLGLRDAGARRGVWSQAERLMNQSGQRLRQLAVALEAERRNGPHHDPVDG